MALFGLVFNKTEHAPAVRGDADIAAVDAFLPETGIVRALHPCVFFLFAVMAVWNVFDGAAEQFGNGGGIAVCGGADMGFQTAFLGCRLLFGFGVV